MGGMEAGFGAPMMEYLKILPGIVFMWIVEPQLVEPRGMSQLSSPSCLCYRGRRETEALKSQVILRGGGLA